MSLPYSLEDQYSGAYRYIHGIYFASHRDNDVLRRSLKPLGRETYILSTYCDSSASFVGNTVIGNRG